VAYDLTVLRTLVAADSPGLASPTYRVEAGRPSAVARGRHDPAGARFPSVRDELTPELVLDRGAACS
jgi:hypothetical protein